MNFPSSLFYRRKKYNIRLARFLHFGPGAGWAKPSNEWLTVDIDKQRGDIVLNLNEFSGFDIASHSIEGIYASHTFEHVSMFKIDRLWEDCARVLKPNCCMRIIVPDVVKSMREYFSGNEDFELFRSRKANNPSWTIFECLKADFISKSGQENLLSSTGLAHQNAWDFETMREQLLRCGFSRVNRSGFKQSDYDCFDFEGSYESEANHEYRSMYVEAVK